MEGLADLFAQDQIMVVHGIVGNGLQLLDTDLAVVAQHRLVSADVDGFAHQVASMALGVPSSL